MAEMESGVCPTVLSMGDPPSSSPEPDLPPPDGAVDNPDDEPPAEEPPADHLELGDGDHEGESHNESSDISVEKDSDYCESPGAEPDPTEEDDDEAPMASEVIIETAVDEGSNTPVPHVDVDIGSTSEFVNILSFCQTFAAILELRPFSFLELEQAIVFSRTEPLYADLVARCIYLGQNRKEPLKYDQWQSLLHRIVKGMKTCFIGFTDPAHDQSESYRSLVDPRTMERSGDDDPPSKQQQQAAIMTQWDTDCHQMTPYARLLILSNLCDWTCSESSDLLHFISSNSPDEFRSSPDGRDAQGNLYRYFPSQIPSQCCRIYRHHCPDMDGFERMALAAQTLEELICFVGSNELDGDDVAAPFVAFIRDEVIPSETAKVEAEQKRAQRLRRQGMSLGVDVSYQNIIYDGRRASSRPVRYTFEDDDPDQAGRRSRRAKPTESDWPLTEGTRSRPISKRR